MIKVEYVEIKQQIKSDVVNEEISRQVEIFFGINAKEALASIEKRNLSGTTKIEKDFYLPHVETNAQEQGVLLIHYYDLNNTKQTALVMVVNSRNPDKKLEEIMGSLLNSKNINKMKHCNSNEEFRRLIQEGD